MASHRIASDRVRSKLINLAQPDTVDERALNIPDEGKKLNPWEMTENQNIVINSARNIGCQASPRPRRRAHRRRHSLPPLPPPSPLSLAGGEHPRV
jgi:hypothetical protein